MHPVFPSNPSEWQSLGLILWNKKAARCIGDKLRVFSSMLFKGMCYSTSHRFGVNFINILRARFSYESLCAAYFYLCFSFVILLAPKFCRSRYQYIPRVSLSVRTGPLYQCKEVARDRAAFSVQCTDNEVW